MCELVLIHTRADSRELYIVYLCLSFVVVCRIVLRFEGKSLDRQSSPDRLIDIMMKNPGELNHQVASVRSGMPMHTTAWALYTHSMRSYGILPHNASLLCLLWQVETTHNRQVTTLL